jgi:hypothetical protein
MRGEVSRAGGESAGGDKINLQGKGNNKPAGEYKNRRNEPRGMAATITKRTCRLAGDSGEKVADKPQRLAQQRL